MRFGKRLLEKTSLQMKKTSTIIALLAIQKRTNEV